jgi:hypothetical protein
MRPIHLIGLFLWRGGILLAAVTAAIESMRLLLRFVDLPVELELGVAFVLAGLALVLVSLVLERLRDYRSEGPLRE